MVCKMVAYSAVYLVDETVDPWESMMAVRWAALKVAPRGQQTGFEWAAMSANPLVRR